MGLLDVTEDCRAEVERWDGTVGPPSPQNRGRVGIRVFESDFVERWFAVSHPFLPVVWFGAFIAYGFVAGFVYPEIGPIRGLLLYAAGMLLWSLLEYNLHRFVFHRQPGPQFGAKLRQFMMHGYHHEFPSDPWRLVAPPLMSWPLAALVFAGYRLGFGPWLCWPLFGGTCAGYLAYDWTHYYTHHFRPKTGLGRYLRRVHMVHHFSNSEANHGISSPLWDVVYGTYQSAAKAPGQEQPTPRA